MASARRMGAPLWDVRPGRASAGRMDNEERLAKQWMRDSIAEDRSGLFVDGKTGEVNATKLAEEYAISIGEAGWLDDELHPIWEWALQVAEGYERGHEPNATGLTAADLRKMRVSDEVNVPCGPAGENLFIKRTKRDEFFIRIPGHEHARWGTAQQAADDIEQFVQYGALPRSSGARMF